MFVILKILWRFKLSKACSALCLEPATKMLDLSFLLKQGLCWTFQISHLEGDIKRDGLRRQRQHLAEGVWPPARNDLHQKWLFSITVCLKCKAFLEHHKQLDLLSAFFFFFWHSRNTFLYVWSRTFKIPNLSNFSSDRRACSRSKLLAC